MKTRPQFRQGDVLLVAIPKSRMPQTLNKLKHKTVAVGEGHHEHIAMGKVQLLEDDRGNLYLAVDEKGELRHVVAGTMTQAEHLPIPLDEGYYMVVPQREYNPYEETINRVRD